MRAVIDPNVLVSAAVAPSGTTARVLKAAFAGRFTLVACPHLVDELERVLRRPAFRRYLALDQAEELVVAVEGVAEVVADPDPVPRLSRDPDDDYLLAIATEHAECLVSGDADLLVLADPPIPVLAPRTFLDQISA